MKDIEAGSGSLLEEIRAIKRKEGISGFYRGLVSSLWLVSNPILQFVTSTFVLIKNDYSPEGSFPAY